MRYVAVACALGLWAGPALAGEMRLDPPTLSARQERCSSRQRAQCEGVAGQRAIDQDLSCAMCDATAPPPLPPEIVAPPEALPQSARPANAPRRNPDCGSRGNSPDDACPALPPLDALPRP